MELSRVKEMSTTAGRHIINGQYISIPAGSVSTLSMGWYHPRGILEAQGDSMPPR